MSLHYGMVSGGAVALPKGIHLPEGLAVKILFHLPKRERADRPASEDTFKQKLWTAGLLAEIKPPAPLLPEGSRAPAWIKGKPLSEVILEERKC